MNKMAFICALLLIHPVTTLIYVGILPDCEKVRLFESVPDNAFIYDAVEEKIKLFGAKNEVLAFQINLVSPKKTYAKLNLKATHLISKSGLIDYSQFKFFKEWYLNVTESSTEMYGRPSSRGAGWYPDPLLPFQYDNKPVAAPLNLLQGARQTIWVDLYIPAATPAGLYQGKIKILNDDVLLKELNIELTVWDFALPDTTHFKTFFYFGPEQLRQAHQVDKNSPLARVLYTKYMQMAHAHRFNLITDIAPEQTWHDFDTYWGQFLEGTAFTEGPGKGVGCSLWPVNIDIWQGQYDFQQQAQFIMQHFYEHGWGDKPFLYVIDEPAEDQYPQVRQVGGWLDDAPYPGNLLPLMLTEPFTPELVGYVDIWNSGQIKLTEIQKRADSDDQFWTYNGGEPGAGSQCIDTDGFAMRSWPWIAWKGHRTAWHYWDCCYFNDRVNRRGETDVWKNPLTYDQRPRGDVDWGNGDGTLFYPGQQFTYGRDFLFGPISSFRMKALRRGIQDYEYLWLAQQLGCSEEVEKIINKILPYPVLGDAKPGQTCYLKDAAIWHQARMELANLILSKLNRR